MFESWYFPRHLNWFDLTEMGYQEESKQHFASQLSQLWISLTFEKEIMEKPSRSDSGCLLGGSGWSGKWGPRGLAAILFSTFDIWTSRQLFDWLLFARPDFSFANYLSVNFRLDLKWVHFNLENNIIKKKTLPGFFLQKKIQWLLRWLNDRMLKLMERSLIRGS